MKSRILSVTFVFLFASSSSFAQAPTAADVNALKTQIENLKGDYEKRIQALETQLQRIQAQMLLQPLVLTSTAIPAREQQPAQEQQPQQPAAQVPPGAEGAGGPTGALPGHGGTAGASRGFNADMAAVGALPGAAASY